MQSGRMQDYRHLLGLLRMLFTDRVLLFPRLILFPLASCRTRLLSTQSSRNILFPSSTPSIHHHSLLFLGQHLHRTCILRTLRRRMGPWLGQKFTLPNNTLFPFFFPFSSLYGAIKDDLYHFCLYMSMNKYFVNCSQ